MKRLQLPRFLRRRSDVPRSGNCHVCWKRKPVGLYEDEHHNLLQACADTRCTTGYRYLMPLKMFLDGRREYMKSLEYDIPWAGRQGVQKIMRRAKGQEVM